jgi:hypothetical protein
MSAKQVLSGHYAEVKRRLGHAPIQALVKPSAVRRRITPQKVYLRPIGPNMPWTGDITAIPTTSYGIACRILRECCEAFGVGADAVLSHVKTPRVLDCRIHVIYRIRRETKWTTPRIGEFMGGRDHTTILHAVRRYELRFGQEHAA